MIIDKKLKGKTIIELILENEVKMRYTPIVASINGKIVSLNEKVSEKDRLEIFDLRSNVAMASYQEGISLIYLTAIKNIVGDVNVSINNSLNKGFYTKINENIEIDDRLLCQLEKEMKRIIVNDFPIRQIEVEKEEAIKLISMYGKGKEEKRAKDKYLKELEGLEKITLGYIEDGEFCYMPSYISLPISTKYLDKFQLVKFKKGILLRFPYQSNPDEIPKLADEKRIYEAFVENSKWQKIMGISSVSELNRVIERKEIDEVIQLAEALQEKKLVEMAKEIRIKKKRIVLIAGPSSSGKTTFAKRFMIHLRSEQLRPIYMGTDDYFVNRDDMEVDEKGEKNFEDLEAIDLTLFNRDLESLLKGDEVDIPTFNFITGKKEFENRKIKINNDQPIVIEGIHGLNPKLIRKVDEKLVYRIYISPIASLSLDLHHRIATSDIRMMRRIVRDYKTRGKSCEATLASWYKVRRGEDKNIFPYSNCCDGFFNTFSLYEIPMLKVQLEKILKELREDSIYMAEKERITSILRKFTKGNYEKEIPRNSIVREFIGGSIFK